MRVLVFLQKKPVRFVLISSFLIALSLGAAFISAAAAQMGDYQLAALSSKLALALALVIVVYIVPRLARNAGLELLRSDLSLGVTSAGWIFFTFVLIVATAALTTGNNLFYIVLAILLAVLMVSGVASRLSLSGVSVSLRFPDHIFAGESTPFEVTLTNQKKVLPSFSLSVAVVSQRRPRQRWWRRQERSPELRWPLSAFGTSAELAYFVIIPGGAKGRVRVEHCFQRRGVYPISGFTLTTRFPFGFVERRRWIAAEGEIVVYPRPQPLDDFYHLLPMSQGKLESPHKGSGSDLYAIRQYLHTDHPRYLDWKATAKTAQLMVREYSRDDDWRITVAVDVPVAAASLPSQEPGVGLLAEKFERAIILAASLIKHFITEGVEVRLIVGCDDLGFGSDNEHCYRLLRHLAYLKLPVNEQSDRSPEQVSGRSGGWGKETTAWSLLDRMPGLAADDQFKILLTPAARGSIPASIWRATHVVYFDDL